MIKTVHGNKTERIHALDSLRAIMMLLGLVLHSALTYAVDDYGASWPLKDSQSTSAIMDYISDIIHIFRMPIFFVVAGFFGAMLFFERGPKKMIKNRIDRILYPFIVFVLLLWPTIIFSFGYSSAAFGSSIIPVSTDKTSISVLLFIIPSHTFHLWFLYYLFLITIVSFVLGMVFNKLNRFTNWTTKQFSRIIQKPLMKLSVMAALTAGILFVMNETWVATSNSWIPNMNTFIFYLFFYIFGWILFKSKNQLESFMKFDFLFTVLAVVVFTLQFLFKSSLSFEITILINSVMVWLFIFGITGLFLRYGSQHSHLMRYNSDSSYWIYLIHLSIVAFLPGLIASWQASAILKFLFVFLLTSLICVVTYHYFVRSTFIGKFLNGRRYSKNIHARLDRVEAKVLFIKK